MAAAPAGGGRRRLLLLLLLLEVLLLLPLLLPGDVVVSAGVGHCHLLLLLLLIPSSEHVSVLHILFISPLFVKWENVLVTCSEDSPFPSGRRRRNGIPPGLLKRKEVGGFRMVPSSLQRRMAARLAVWKEEYGCRYGSAAGAAGGRREGEGEKDL